MAHAQSMRSEYDNLVDDDLVLACVDDFCRLTVRHRVKKGGGAAGGGGGDSGCAYSALRGAGPGNMAGVLACHVESETNDEAVAAPRHHKVCPHALARLTVFVLLEVAW